MRKENYIERKLLTLLGTLVILTLTACGQEPAVEHSVICCELADGTISSETTADCKKAGGSPVADDLCECDDDVCCELADGTFQTLPESECQTIAAPERCNDVDPTAEICCKTEDGFQTVLASDCPDDQIAAAELCDEEVCCMDAVTGTAQTVPASECPDNQIIAADMCADEVCCIDADGTTQTVPASQCPDSQIVAADMCADDVCCIDADGNAQTVPASECPDSQIVDAELCIDEDVCCRIDGVFVTVPASQCPAGQLAPAESCVEEDVCCRINGQFVTVPSGDCPDAQLAPADMCEEDICCQTAAGIMTVPASECPQAQQLSADVCVEVCCKTALGVQYLPAGECDAAQIASNDVCDQEICCKTIDGYETIPQSDCPQAQLSDPLFCEEEVCCRTPNGDIFVPGSQCEAAAVLPDDQCITADTECIKFRAVDMSNLPYTTTAGDTLQSFSSFWSTFSVATGWSSSCLDLPAGVERAVVGVGNDLTLNFAAPVSSLFLLRYHAQPGDDLIVPGGFTSPTFCGASSYNNVTKVDLMTPSTSVTIQDISPNGGTGYSVLLAECIEWAQN